MYYNYYQTNQYEYDECITKGICSINPTLSSLQEVILLSLKELAFYLLKLKALGVSNEQIKEAFIDALSSIVTNAEYSQEQFNTIMSTLHDELNQAKLLYMNLCEKNNLDFQTVKTYFKQHKSFDITNAIKKGEKFFLKKNVIFTTEQKNLFDIMLFLVKSVCIKILELKSLDKDYEDAYYAMLSMLSTMNFNDFSGERAKKEIEEFVNVYYELIKRVYYTHIELYGEMGQVEVSFSSRPGKALMVSGSDLKELEIILETTAGRGIDVYTHGTEMLMAHTFPKFRTYPHLIGHFGTGMDNCLIDFATFPGAILMTKHSLQKIEYLYRGRLFTTDLIAPKGVIKLTKNDFEPLIQSTLSAKGFSKGQQRPPLKVGFNEVEVLKKVNEVLDKVETGEIKHIYIIGLMNYANEHKAYFDKFFDLVPKNCFIFSLSQDKSGDNIFHQDSFFEYSLIYKIFKEMKKRKPLNEIKMSIFLTKCDKHTIANVLQLKNSGIKNVYMCKCSPALVNPALIDSLKNLFGVKQFFNPEEDIQRTLAED